MKLTKAIKEPYDGERRIRVGFAWFPKKVWLDNHNSYLWVWLENYYVIQVYKWKTIDFPILELLNKYRWVDVSYKTISVDVLIELNKKWGYGKLELPSKMNTLWYK